MQFNPNPKRFDYVRVVHYSLRMVFDAMYIKQLRSAKSHEVRLPTGKVVKVGKIYNWRFQYPVEQMENYKAKSNDTKTAV